MAGRLMPPAVRRDIQHGGAYEVSGTVQRLGAPGRYMVTLFVRRTKRPIRSQVSAADGAYAFEWIADAQYFVAAFDHVDPTENAAITDLATVTPM